MRLTLLLLTRRGSTCDFQYWKRYVDRRQAKMFRRYREWHPLVGWQEKTREHYYYDEKKPWTDEFLMENMKKPDTPHIPIGKPIKDWKMFVGDRVSHVSVSCLYGCCTCQYMCSDAYHCLRVAQVKYQAP